LNHREQNPTTSSNWRSRVKRYGPLAFWIALVFFFSSGEASAAQTSRIIRPILEFLFPGASESTLVQLHFFIRKLAHLTEYSILAFWAVRAWKRSSYTIVSNNRYLFAIALVLVVASLDEFNQSFEPSRTSTVWDVALDVTGGVVMVLFIRLFELWKQRRIRRSQGSQALPGNKTGGPVVSE